MHIVILGGYGNAGREIARLLALKTAATLTLVGRDARKARQAADQLSRETGRSLDAACADAARRDSLDPLLRRADLLVVASSSLDHVATVAEAALATETDYLDILLSSPAKVEALRRLEPAIAQGGRCFITDGGYHPGVPAAMVRYAALRLPRLERATVGGSFSLDWTALSFSEATMAEFVTELKAFDPSAFVDGRWVRSLRNTRRYDFGPPLGRKSCVAMQLEEMKTLPERIPSLRETGFYVAGFGPVIDYALMPLCFGLLALMPGRAVGIGRLFLWGLRRFAGAKTGTVLLLEAGAQAARMTLRLAHPDAYLLTAAPVAACLMQYLAGPRKPGLWTQAHYVEPARFFDDLRDLGIAVQESRFSDA